MKSKGATDRKQIEKALRESEKKYQYLYDNAPDMYHSLDKNGIIIDCNETEARMLGYKKDEIIDRPFKDFLTEESRKLFERDFPKLNKEKTRLDLEREFVRKDGTTFLASLSVSTEFDEKGKIIRTNTIARDITERKLIEKALQESEERYRRLVELSPEGIAVHSGGKVVYINKAGAKLIGAKNPDEVIGKPIMDFVHPDYHKLVTERVQQTQEKGAETELIEEKFIRLDGQVIDVEVVAIPTMYREMPATQVIIRDITKRKKAEEELKLFSKAVEEAADAINIINREGKFIFVNPEFCRMHGYTAKELIGESFLITVPEKDRGIATRYLKDAISEQRAPKNFEGESVCKDGSIIEVQGKWSHIYKDSKVTGTMAIIRDITERKQAEQQIRDIINAAPDMIHVISPDMRIIKRNSASGKLFPHVKEGDHCYKALHGRDEACPHCGVTKVFKSGEKEAHESKITLPDGKVVIVYSTSSPIFDEKGGIVAAVEILHDITGRKKAEEELTMYAQKLEHSNRLKDLFTDIMRHDLINPVDVIKNLAEMLTEEDKYKDSKDLQMILSSARKTEEMIIATAAYAKLEGAEDIEWEDMDLNAIIKNAEDVVRPYFEEKHVEIEHLPEGEYIARTIPLVEEVFVNFLSNAMKYSPENTKVTVNIEDKGKNWRVTVTDRGTGVPDKFKNKIFDRFVRRKKEGVRGSGIGLAIVKRIADLHGGTTGVLDNPEGGSIFYFDIPKTEEVKT